MIQWWAGAAVLAAAALVGLVAWWAARPRRMAGAPVPVAHLDRVRALPGFRALAQREWQRRRIEAGCLLLAVVGAALMCSRLVGVSDDSEEMRTREVVLCLDVSGSMHEVDADVIDTYLALVKTLKDERIGFVMFDAHAVTVFPLTTDRDYIARELAAAKPAIDPGPVPGTLAPLVGSSLIGDGLASCVQQFDQRDPVRSRTVVLATDNVVSGDSIYTVSEAGKLAENNDIMVFGVMPVAKDRRPTEQLRAAVRPTAGDIISITAGEPTNLARISSAIKAQQKTALLAMAQERSFDRVWPGAVLLLAGLAGSLLVVWRRP